jgi:response regulator RpfG family c-di-GMP phosphodiesterase
LRGVSLRVRVAAVVALAAILCALVMGILGFRITRVRIGEVAGGASVDVVSMLAAELVAKGITPEAFQGDASMRGRAQEALLDAIVRLNEVGSVWTNATILEPEGDRWRILAIASVGGSEHRLHEAGDVIDIIAEDPKQSISVERPAAGWFTTDLNDWFGATVPLGGKGGVVTMTMHTDEAAAYLRQVLETVLGALGASILLGLALGWWSAGLILRPLEAIRDFAARLGRREYASRMRLRGAPEIQRLLRDMNRLAEELGQRDVRLHERMARMAETRDPKETGQHVKRVSEISMELLEGWLLRHPMEPQQANFARETLQLAAVLHDVGKVGVSDAVLKKPGKLDEAEYDAMKHHSVLATAVLPGTDPYDVAAREVALRHHERWDGKGYPGKVDLSAAHDDIPRLLELPLSSAGLAGTEIPLFARIVSIADVYDALSSPRAYKEQWPEAKVVETIRADSGKAFDPELVEIFLERRDRIRAAWARHPEPAGAHGFSALR